MQQQEQAPANSSGTTSSMNNSAGGQTAQHWACVPGCQGQNCSLHLLPKAYPGVYVYVSGVCLRVPCSLRDKYSKLVMCCGSELFSNLIDPPP